MNAVHRGAGAVLKYLTPLYVVLIIVQVFLAGEGIFGIKDGQGLEDAKSLDAHRGFGFIIAQPGALLFLIVALLWWPRNKRILGLNILFAVLLIVQSFLPSAGRWVAALHPLNAFALLALAGYLSHWWWRRGGEAEVREPVPVAR
ncbi:MAG TPA: hypothetical protein VF101_12480 [Gaiellaceae bacterium]